jgi:predicted DNA-binding transcriptional regulator AlpA
MQTGTAARSPTKNVRGAQPLSAARIPHALLTLRTAAAVAGVSEATLYRRAQTDPTFPRLIKDGLRCTRIQAGALAKWLEARAGGPS